MGLLHDVGKIGIDDHVLKKTGPLTPEEYRQIQSHVEIGVHILSDLKKLHHLLPGVRHHHESLDGTGYPVGPGRRRRSRSRRGSWPSPTRSTRCRAPAPTAAASPRCRSTRSSARAPAPSGTPRSSTPSSPAAMDVETIRQKGLGESLQLVVNETLGRT